MAEQTFKFNEDIVKAKFAALAKSRDDQAGKTGNGNPFLWYRDNVASKQLAFNKGDRTKELYDAVLSTKEFAPKIVVAVKEA